MTIAELKDIIDNNAEGAEAGNLQCQCQVIEAQAEIERLEREAEEASREEWCEGAGLPVAPFTEALEAKARLEAEAREREANTDFSMLTDDEFAGDW